VGDLENKLQQMNDQMTRINDLEGHIKWGRVAGSVVLALVLFWLARRYMKQAPWYGKATSIALQAAGIYLLSDVLWQYLRQRAVEQQMAAVGDDLRPQLENLRDRATEFIKNPLASLSFGGATEPEATVEEVIDVPVDAVANP